MATPGRPPTLPPISRASSGDTSAVRYITGIPAVCRSLNGVRRTAASQMTTRKPAARVPSRSKFQPARLSTPAFAAGTSPGACACAKEAKGRVNKNRTQAQLARRKKCMRGGQGIPMGRQSPVYQPAPLAARSVPPGGSSDGEGTISLAGLRGPCRRWPPAFSSLACAAKCSLTRCRSCHRCSPAPWPVPCARPGCCQA